MSKLKYFLLAIFILSLNNTIKGQEFKINSREYKLLLDGNKFKHRTKAFKEFWNIVKIVAAEQGLTVIEKSNKKQFKEKRKAVSFLDTKNFDLRKHGYLLRKKVKFKHGKPQHKFEYSLKFRSKKPAITAAADVTISPNYKPKYDKIELEEDVVYNVDTKTGYEITCSRQNIVELTQEPGKTLGDYARIYPVLAKLGVAPSTPLGPIHNIVVEERLVRPGKIVFGEGLTGRVDMTVWLATYKNRHITIAEFSYDHEVDNEGKISPAAMTRCMQFMKHLQKKAPEWVVAGDLKAAILFKLER